MKSKKEIQEWLLANCVDEEGNLDLTELDFSNFDGDVMIDSLKVKKDLFQYNQKVEGNLYQGIQNVKKNLYQHNQKVGRDLLQNYQTVKGKLIQKEEQNNETN